MTRVGTMRRRAALAAVVFLSALATAFGLDLRLAWDPPTSNEDGSPVTDLAGYTVHYGENSGAYSDTLDAGAREFAVVSGLTSGKTYYFAVSAYNSLGLGSSLSEEFAWTATGESATSIEGTVQYRGAKSGPVTVMMYSEPSFASDPVRTIDIPAAGSYAVDEIEPGVYYLIAFMKAGRPLDPDFVSASAPWAVYGTWADPAPVAVAAGETVPVDITLVDGGPDRRNPFACHDAPGDFDGDGRSDQGLYVSSTGMWTLRCTQDGVREFAFGYEGAQPVVGDFDNDGKDDIGVYDASTGSWYLQRSAYGFSHMQFGYAGTIPVPADYDGDGVADLAVYDPGTGAWYVLRSAKGFWTAQFGYTGVLPMPADYDGDGVADLAVYDTNSGNWFILGSAEGFSRKHFGYTGVLPVPADYDGDGRVDIAVYDPRNGFWSRRMSFRGQVDSSFGFAGALPAVGDFDGDGAVDIGVYSDAHGTWFDQQSRKGFRTTPFTAARGARPVSNGR
jgi:hypothetical protein